MCSAGRVLAPLRIRRWTSSMEISSKCRRSQETCSMNVRFGHGPFGRGVVGDTVVEKRR